MAGPEAAQLKNELAKREPDPRSTCSPVDWEKELSPDELELLHEIFRALRVIRYGSVLLTVHDGQVVEVQKTERVRKAAAKRT